MSKLLRYADTSNALLRTFVASAQYDVRSFDSITEHLHMEPPLYILYVEEKWGTHELPQRSKNFKLS